MATYQVHHHPHSNSYRYGPQEVNILEPEGPRMAGNVVSSKQRDGNKPVKVTSRAVAKELTRTISKEVERAAKETTETESGHTDTVDLSESCDISEDPLPKGKVTAREDSGPLSMDFIKRLVLESLPRDIRSIIPEDSWNRIFDEANAVFSEDLESLQESSTKENVEDLVSFISVYVQREAKERLPSRVSAVSDVTEAQNEDPSSSVALRAPMAAVALKPIPRTIVDYGSDKGDDGENKDESIDSKLVDNQDSFGPPLPPPVPSMEASPGPIGIVTITAESTILPSSNTPPPRSSIRKDPESALGGWVPPDDDRKITFARVDIRYYEPILSDNPAVTNGPPIGIGWKYRIMRKSLTVDAWEYRQEPNRRFLTDLVISRQDRTSMLYDLGYTQSDLAKAIRDVVKTKNRRKQTFNNLRYEFMEELMERASRKVKKVLSFGGASRQEKALLYYRTAKLTPSAA